MSAEVLLTGAARELLARPMFPFRNHPALDVESWLSYRSEELRAGIERGDLHQFALHNPNACFFWRPLSFDSEVLGVRMASLETSLFEPATSENAESGLVELASALRSFGQRLLLAKVSAADRALHLALARTGWELLATHSDFLFDTSSAAPPRNSAEWSIELSTRADAEEIAELSAANYAPFDRFAIDPLLPAERIPEIYRRWGRNAVEGYADFVFVARSARGEIVGFGAWREARALAPHLPARHAWYDLAAVAGPERGSGIFRALSEAGLAELRARGIRWASGATNVLNTPAQRVFIGLGGYPYDTLLTYRKDLADA